MCSLIQQRPQKQTQEAGHTNTLPAYTPSLHLLHKFAILLWKLFTQLEKGKNKIKKKIK